MATTFVIACPDCGKQVKVSEEHLGKRVKCKECGTVYPVRAPAGAAAPAAKKSPPPAPGKGKAKSTPAKAPPSAEEEPAAPADIARVSYREGMDDDDEDGPKQYSLEKTNDTLPRCPFCAMEMEAVDARICLHCGYNTRTRQRPIVKHVYQHTAGELFLHWLPGILCILTMIGLLVWYIIFWMNIEVWMEDSWFEDEKGPPVTYLGGLGPGFLRLYLFLLSAALYVPLFRIAWKRLVKQNKPQERKIKEE
ncbi:MAG TPA: hypothetical protein VHR66_20555 [Gemmataceae bacterium]|nr:hypothetical protein [Gemmataceae bacterium]